MGKRNVIVIGGGPSGMMASGQAAGMGADTLLFEKMQRPGRKLGITGKGRCNLTNVASLPEFISHFGSSGTFLRQAFHRFSNDELVVFFEDLGVPTVVERGGRVFPASGQARDVVDALTGWMRKQGVEVRRKMSVDGLLIEEQKVCGVRDFRGETYPADAVIIATGGVSYPVTGSTGDGYRLARLAGHSIVPVRPALIPLETGGDVAQRLQGLSMRNVNVRVLVDGRKENEAFGEMLFTHFGLSGPIILSLSGKVTDALDMGRRVTISIDLKPALDEHKLDERLLRDLDAHGKRKFQTLLEGLLPGKLIPVCMELTGIPPDRRGHQITTGDRRHLRAWLKDFRLEVTGTRPISEAVITAGGINTEEINPRTLASRLVGGLYFAGEVMDIDARTGGYNLQAAFSTGWLAGRSAARQ